MMRQGLRGRIVGVLFAALFVNACASQPGTNTDVIAQDGSDASRGDGGADVQGNDAPASDIATGDTSSPDVAGTDAVAGDTATADTVSPVDVPGVDAGGVDAEALDVSVLDSSSDDVASFDVARFDVTRRDVPTVDVVLPDVVTGDDVQSMEAGRTDAGMRRCTSDSDCRLYSSYCASMPCVCIALDPGESPPRCMGGMVTCFVDPCLRQTATCSPSGMCTLR